MAHPRKNAVPCFAHTIPRFVHAIPRFAYAIPYFSPAVPRFTHTIPRFTPTIPRFGHAIPCFSPTVPRFPFAIPVSPTLILIHARSRSLQFNNPQNHKQYKKKAIWPNSQIALKVLLIFM